MKEAVKRVADRARKVGPDVIHSQNAKLITLKPYLEELFKQQESHQPIPQDSSNPRAIIVDLDGTLAINTQRNPFDWSRVEEDTLSKPVYNAMKALQDKGYTVLLCSGRSEESRAGTERWLAKHDITYESLHMRPLDDQRSDYLVKEEMWRELTKNYYIELMLDDRNSVVNHARRLGFTVFQVAPGNF